MQNPTVPIQKTIQNNHDSFSAALFPSLARLEARNFWFRGRNKLIIWAINSYAASSRNFLEMGCGTGFVLSAISESFPKMQLTGSELFPEAFSFAQQRVPGANFIAMDARDMTYEGCFDAVGAFDVLEHIDDDTEVLKRLAGALVVGGYLFATVPQHSFLWSPSDELAFHCRRYEVGELESKVSKAGFEIVRSSSFVFFLLPLMFLSRLWQRLARPNFSVMSELQTPVLISWLFEKLLDFELLLLRVGINLPIGGSRMVIARRGVGRKGEKVY